MTYPDGMLIYCAGAAVITWFFLRWLLASADKMGLTDVPNERSSHTRPTPKGGGAAILVPVAAGLLVYLEVNGLFATGPMMVFWLLSLVLGLVGWLDDVHEISRGIRFAAEGVAALVVIMVISSLPRFYIPFAGELVLGLTGTVMAVVWISGTINIFNFIDGVDGIAALQAVSASAGWLYMSWLWDVPPLFVLNAMLLASLAVFLRFNRPPARIFMGDTGSLFLGFAYSTMPLLAAVQSEEVQAAEAIWIGALLLWPSLWDGSYTIVRRLFRGENILRAHRSHLYQRLDIAGWSHGKVSLLYFAFSLTSLVAAILFIQGDDLPVVGLQSVMEMIPGGINGQRLIILGVLGALSLLLVAWVRRVEKTARA